MSAACGRCGTRSVSGLHDCTPPPIVADLEAQVAKLREDLEMERLMHQAYRAEVVAEIAVQVTEDCDWDELAKWVGGSIGSAQEMSGEYRSWINVPANRTHDGKPASAGCGEWITLGHDGKFRVRYAVDPPERDVPPSPPVMQLLASTLAVLEVVIADPDDPTVTADERRDALPTARALIAGLKAERSTPIGSADTMRP